VLNRRWLAEIVLLTAATLVGCGSSGETQPLSAPATSDSAGSAVAGAPAASSAVGGAKAVAGTSGTSVKSSASGGAMAASAAAAGSNAPAAAGGAGTAQAMAPVASAGAPAGGEMAPEKGGETAPTAGGKPRRAISADFLNQTLSIVDVDKLVPGATKDDALIGTVDLSMYVPGPLSVAVTPDGKTALASISGGWLRLLPEGSDVPAGAGTLVFVDLETFKVKGELKVGTDPLGIAITHDGKHAFVGVMSESYMAYVDIEKMSYMPIQTGNQWNEEVAIDDTGSIGALTTGTGGDTMGFVVDMPAMHGQTRGLTGDAGGVAFFPGTKSTFVVQAPTQLTGMTGGYNVLDLTDPSMPMVTDSVRTMADQNQAYPVTPVPSRKSVVYPSSDKMSRKLTLHEMALEGGKAKLVQDVEVGESVFVYNLGATPEGTVLAASGAEHQVFVVDLNTGKSFAVPWGTTKTGPQDIKYIP
jgi:DNA-binding beta-propeller fold protein YncE